MMIGQENQEQAWIGALASGRLPHAWLLAGPMGVGKAGFALRAATYLICDGDKRAVPGAASIDTDPTDRAAQQIAHGTHPDFIWLKREVPEAKRPKDGGAGKAEDVATTISVSQVRAMLARLRMRPANARWRVVVIDSIDDMERGPANALLKTLEEPPENTIFLLISHQPGRLLPTIRSRCRMLRFDALDAASMRSFIAANVSGSDDGEVDALLALAQGSPGRAMLFAGADIATLTASLHAIARTGDGDNALRSELIRTATGAGGAKRLDILLHMAGVIAADHARTADGSAVITALDTRDKISVLTREAASASADNATIAFAAGTALARLATLGNRTAGR